MNEGGSLGGARLGSAYARVKASRASMWRSVVGGALLHRLLCGDTHLEYRLVRAVSNERVRLGGGGGRIGAIVG